MRKNRKNKYDMELINQLRESLMLVMGTTQERVKIYDDAPLVINRSDLGIKDLAEKEPILQIATIANVYALLLPVLNEEKIKEARVHMLSFCMYIAEMLKDSDILLFSDEELNQ